MFALTRQDTSVMKGIAICAMLCHHIYGFPLEGMVPYSGVPAWLGGLGKACVALFLFCSGYGLAANYKAQSLLDDVKFVVKRLVKFYANYWVIFLIFVPITIFAFHRPLVDAYGLDSNVMACLLKDIVGIQGYKFYNPSWWFNLLIIILYLLFPIMYRLAQRLPLICLIVGLILSTTAYHVQGNIVDVYVWQLPFLFGILYHQNERNFPKLSSWVSSHRMAFIGMTILLIVITIILRMYPIIPRWNGARMDAFLSVEIALLTISLIRILPHVGIALVYLGKHSINIYLMHTFFVVFYWKELLHTSEWMRGGGNFILVMTICILISIGIEFMKEKIRLYEFVNFITKRI